ARVREVRGRVDGRGEHRRRRSDGVLPVRRRQRQLLRRSQSARPRRNRVLHRQEGHDLALVLAQDRQDRATFMRTLIKNGTVVTATDQYRGDVLIEDEKIALIGTTIDIQADKTIEASAKYVLPG